MSSTAEVGENLDRIAKCTRTGSLKGQTRKNIPAGKICPKCNGDLIDRKGKQGVFWRCSNYPDCRYRQGPRDLEEKGRPAT